MWRKILHRFGKRTSKRKVLLEQSNINKNENKKTFVNHLVYLIRKEFIMTKTTDEVELFLELN